MPTPAKPPSTESTCPVMNELSSEQRNTAVRACWKRTDGDGGKFNGKYVSEHARGCSGPRRRHAGAAARGSAGARERGTYYLGGETKPRKRGLTHPGPDHVRLNVVRLAVLVHGRVLGCRARIVRHGHRSRTAPRSRDGGQRYAAGEKPRPKTPLPRACAAMYDQTSQKKPPVHNSGEGCAAEADVRNAIDPDAVVREVERRALCEGNDGSLAGTLKKNEG